MKNIENIEITDVQEIIPDKLLKRFNTLDLKTLGDILNLKPLEILNLPDSAVQLYSKFKIFQERVKYNPEEFINHKNKIAEAPFEFFKKQKEINFNLSSIEKSIISYIYNLRDDLSKNVLLYAYGFCKNSKCSTEKIGQIFNETPEKINKIRSLAIKEIYGQIQQELSGNQELSSPLAKLHKHLNESLISTEEILPLAHIETIIKNNSDWKINPNKDNTILFVVRSFGFEFDNTQLCYFTKGKYFFRTQIQKDEFLDTIQKTLSVLRSIIMPLNKANAIAEVKHTNKKLKDSYIEIVLNTLPEIEILDINDETHYQVKFESLSNSNDRTFRILKEMKEPMKIFEMVKEQKRRLNKVLSRTIYIFEIRALRRDNRFIITQNDTYLELAEWNQQPITTNEVVKSSLEEPLVS